jgi:hypothetical protein
MLDRQTKGRTSPGRLRALDAYLLDAERDLLLAPPTTAAFVDVGFGEHPFTPLESAGALRTVHPTLRVIALDRDPARAAAAQPHADDHTRFAEGGFEALSGLGPLRIVRAMNVLRTYREDEVPAAHALLGANLIEGGLVLEGSADPQGAILTCHLLRRRAGTLHREALLFFTDFTHGFAPLLFRDWLPRDLRRRVVPGEPIHAFFAAWTHAWSQVRQADPDPRAAFTASAQALAALLPGVEADPRWLSRGYLLYRPPSGIPQPLP